jgi:uncharacterized paraquat-inducible protein A
MYKQNKQTNKDIRNAIKTFSIIAILPLSLLSFVRHTILNGSIIKTNTPFFEIEVGGVNIAISIAIIISYLLSLNNKTYTIILLIYAIYLSVSCISSFLYISHKKAYTFLPVLIVIYYFIIKSYNIKEIKTQE